MSSIENKGKVIYLDNAATTKMSEEVKEAMDPYLEEKFGNASTMYGYGETSRQALEKARKTIAGTLEAKPSEIFFTSGGSESDNWAVKCIAGEYKHKGKHIITSKIEHHAILNSCKYLEELGYEVTYLDVDEYGMVSPEAVYHAIREDTTLITIMFGNNEVGTIEPVFSIGKIAREKDVLFHTDAVQAYAQVPISVRHYPVDLLSATGKPLQNQCLHTASVRSHRSLHQVPPLPELKSLFFRCSPSPPARQTFLPQVLSDNPPSGSPHRTGQIRELSRCAACDTEKIQRSKPLPQTKSRFVFFSFIPILRQCSLCSSVLKSPCGIP